MLKCNQYLCNETLNDDAIDHKCFYCGDIFCIDHIDDYFVGSIKDARKRIDDIQNMNIDKDYLEDLIEELKSAEEIYSDLDEIIVYHSIRFPICECCLENLMENNRQWKKIIEKDT